MTTDRPAGTPRDRKALRRAMMAGLTVTTTGVAGTALRGDWAAAAETLALCLLGIGLGLAAAYRTRTPDHH